MLKIIDIYEGLDKNDNKQMITNMIFTRIVKYDEIDTEKILNEIIDDYKKYYDNNFDIDNDDELEELINEVEYQIDIMKEIDNKESDEYYDEKEKLEIKLTDLLVYFYEKYYKQHKKIN